MHAKARIIAFVIATATLLAGAVQAQDTIGIYADFGEGLTPSVITKPGEPFDVVIVAETSKASGAAEFVATELMHLYPGVFKVNTDKINNTPMDLGDNQNGEYILAFGGCEPAGELELVRIRYYDLNGEIGENVVLQLRGFREGDSIPRPRAMAYAPCDDSGLVALKGREWDSSSGIDPLLIEGVVSTDGMLVLNPVGISVSSDATSVGALKSRF